MITYRVSFVVESSHEETISDTQVCYVDAESETAITRRLQFKLDLLSSETLRIISVTEVKK